LNKKARDAPSAQKRLAKSFRARPARKTPTVECRAKGLMRMSSKKHQKVVAARAAMDALIANDPKQLKILMGAAPFPPTWNAMDDDWQSCLASGVARGSGNHEALAVLFANLRRVGVDAVAEFWRAAATYAWDEPATKGSDPFLNVLRLRREQHAEWLAEGLAPFFKVDIWRENESLNLGGPKMDAQRWRAALAEEPSLASPFWRAAVGGLSLAHAADAPWRSKFIAETATPETKAALSAASLELAVLAADAMALRQREQELGLLAQSSRWQTEPESKLDSHESEWEKLHRMPARGFNAAAAVLEARGARWDAKLMTGAKGKENAEEERRLQKAAAEKYVRWETRVKKAAKAEKAEKGVSEQSRIDAERLELGSFEPAPVKRRADGAFVLTVNGAPFDRASGFSDSLLANAVDFAPAFERARNQLGSKVFWGLFENAMLDASAPARSLRSHYDTSLNEAMPKRWRRLLLRVDAELPENIAERAARECLRAAMQTRGQDGPRVSLEPLSALKPWRGLCDFASKPMSSWLRSSWPDREPFPTPETLGKALRDTRSDTLDLLTKAVGALCDLGVALPWKSSDVPTLDKNAAFQSVLERVELQAEVKAGIAETAPASASAPDGMDEEADAQASAAKIKPPRRV